MKKIALTIMWALLSVSPALTQVIEGRIHVPEDYRRVVYIAAIDTLQDLSVYSPDMIADSAHIDKEGKFSLHIPDVGLYPDGTIFRVSLTKKGYPAAYRNLFSDNETYVYLQKQDTVQLTAAGDRMFADYKTGGNTGSRVIREINTEILRSYFDSLYKLVDHYEGKTGLPHDSFDNEVFSQIREPISGIVEEVLRENMSRYIDTATTLPGFIYGMHHYGQWIGGHLLQNFHEYEERVRNHHLSNFESNLLAWIEKHPSNPYLLELGRMQAMINTHPVLTPKEVNPALELPGYRDKEKPQKLLNDGEQLVLIDFFATWCVPCVNDHKNVLPDLYEAFSDEGFTIITVSLDRSREEIITYAEENPVPWETAYLPSDVQDEYFGKLQTEVQSLPYYMLMNSEGRILNEGFSSQQAKSLIRHHIEQN